MRRNDAGQHRDRLMRLQAVADSGLDRLCVEHAAVRPRSVVQPHADEFHVLADRAVESVAAHVDFRISRQLHVGKRGERPVGLALVHGGEALAH